MHKRSLKIVNPLGLHARAAAKFVNLAKTFASQVHVANDGPPVDGKSIMNVMMLSAPQGTDIDLHVEGSDEDQAMSELTALVENGFGELDDPV